MNVLCTSYACIRYKALLRAKQPEQGIQEQRSAIKLFVFNYARGEMFPPLTDNERVSNYIKSTLIIIQNNTGNDAYYESLKRQLHSGA